MTKTEAINLNSRQDRAPFCFYQIEEMTRDEHFALHTMLMDCAKAQRKLEG